MATPLQPSLASDMPYRSEERSERSGPTSRDLWQHRPDPFPASVPQLRPRSRTNTRLTSRVIDIGILPNP